jgi:hypothetical protein
MTTKKAIPPRFQEGDRVSWIRMQYSRAGRKAITMTGNVHRASGQWVIVKKEGGGFCTVFADMIRKEVANANNC